MPHLDCLLWPGYLIDQANFYFCLSIKYCVKYQSWTVWFSKNFFGDCLALRSHNHLGFLRLIRFKSIVNQPRILFVSRALRENTRRESGCPSDG